MDLLQNDVVRRRTLEIAENYLHTKHFTIHIEGGTEKGDNYIGVVLRAKFHTKNEENQNENTKNCKKLDLVVKVPPENKVRREKFFTRPCFIREALAYDEILPMFMRFQESKGITPIKDGFYEIPHCFGTITDDGFEAIFLKDLMVDGFEMYNRQNYLTHDHVNIVMKSLAKFHAISYAIKDQCPEKLAKFKELKDIFRDRETEKELSMYMTMLKDRAVAILCQDTQQNVIQKIDRMFKEKTFMNLMLDLTLGDVAEPYSVICHGDCWNNNVLYKYENGRPVEVRLIDWQILRYASPVCDLMYFIFLATSKEDRKKYYSDFLDTYYNTLTSYLTRLGSNPSESFPRKAFDDQLIKYGKFGFLMACMLMPLITTYTEDIPDLDEVSERMAKGHTDENAFKSERSQFAYKERMGGVIVDMFELGYI